MRYFILLFFTVLSFSNHALEKEYLICNGDSYHTWGGYTIMVKVISGNKYAAILFQEKLFSPGDYTLPFILWSSTNQGTIKFESSVYDIKFILDLKGRDAWGRLSAEAFRGIYADSSELLCEEMDRSQFFNEYVKLSKNPKLEIFYQFNDYP